MTLPKLLLLALVAAFFALAEADFETLQEDIEDDLATSRSRFSNLELLLKEEHKAEPLYKEVETTCDDVEHQFDLLVAEIVKLREPKDLKHDTINSSPFRRRVEPIIKKLSKEAEKVKNLMEHKDKKGELVKMLHDKVTHDVIMRRLRNGYDMFEVFVINFWAFEKHANTA